MRPHLASRLDEFESVLVAARVEMMLGNLDRAEDLLRPLSGGRRGSDSKSLLGRVLLLKGEGEAGIPSLVEALGEASALGAHNWTAFFRPELEILAERMKVELPNLAVVDAAAASRRLELADSTDPIAELARATAGFADPIATRSANVLCTVLLHLIRGETTAAQQALDSSGTMIEGDPELELLRASPQSSSIAVEQGREGERDDGQPSQEEVFALEAILPPSWFIDATNQAENPPLLARYIPEMRFRAGWAVPGVQVSVDEELEPDRYRIMVKGKLAAEGTADPNRLYLSPDIAQALDLPLDGDAALELPGLSSLWPVSKAAASRAANGLGQLLAIPTQELVARHLGAIVNEHAVSLGGSERELADEQ
jgi:hypothetical protein